MEQATLQKIARLRRLAGQQGKPFDVMRFTFDTVYARERLGVLLNTDDEETLLVGMSLMNEMFPASALSLPSMPPATPAVATTPPAVAQSGQYVGRLR